MYKFVLIVFFLSIFAFAHESDQDLNQVATVRLRVADRVLVRSVLLDLFGPESDKIVQQMIMQSSAVFGGPCDMYEEIRLDGFKPEFADPSVECPGGKMSMNLSMNGSMNAVRQGYIAKTCEKLVTTPETYSFAMNRIFPEKTEVKINSENLNKAFVAWNPERPLPDNVMKSLSKIKQWKFILMTLCLDPSWQIL